MRNHEEQTEQPKQVAGENKTYEQRLNDLATEFAIAEWDAMQPSEDKQWNSGYLEEGDKECLISGYVVSAAIALKHMAYWHEIGYTHGAFHEPQIGLQQSLGLIQPQKT